MNCFEPKEILLGLEVKSQGRSSRTPFRYRSSYTAANAAFFKPTFNRMIAERKDFTITSEDTGLTPGTLNLKAQDALKWLVDNDGGEGQYAKLRQQISISRTATGVALYFKSTLTNLIAKATAVAVNPDEVNRWKKEFETWLSTAQAGEIWDSQLTFPSLMLTVEDKAWLTKILSALDGVEVAMTDTKLKVMR